jgi:hypothetical protein
MKPRITALLVVLFFSAFVMSSAQAEIPRSRTYTMPVAPPRELLDRLNLQMSYRIYVPMDGRHDGLSTVQLDGNDLYVQTRSGLVTLINAETGETLWRQRVGRDYVAEHELAFNSREVYVINNTYLYALNRRTGGLNWSTRLAEGVAAPPVADENVIYIPTQTGRLTAYLLPRPDLALALTEGPDSPAAKEETAEQKKAKIPYVRRETSGTTTTVSHLTESAREATTTEEGVGPALQKLWTEVSSLRLELPLVLTKDRVLMPTSNGIVAAVAKIPLPSGAPNQVYRFSTESPIRVPAAAYEGTLYVGGEDANLYALEMSSGRLSWRFTAGTAISRKPAVTDEDIYLVAARTGMTRLDRATGEPRWRIPVRGELAESNAAADRFLAVNPKYVYAVDFSGRFLVIDRRRGVTLSGFETREFVFPVSNTTTDRIFLAANNGLIVCLHDREYTRPIRHRLREEEAANPLRQRLAQPIMDVGTKPMELRDMLQLLSKRYPPLKFRIDDVAFQTAGRDSPALENVKMPNVKDKPLGTVLRDMLAAIKSTYEIIADTIVILPAAAEK